MNAWKSLRYCSIAWLTLGAAMIYAAEIDETKKAGPVVRLLDPGAEPRSELRYRYVTDSPSTMLMDMKMSMQMQVGENVAPRTSIPRMRNQMEITPESVAADGNLRYRFTLSKVGIAEGEDAPPQLRELLVKDLQSMVGLSGSATVTPRGLTEEAEINVPEDAPRSITQMIQNLQQSIRQMAVPFPEEPVGIGAKWEVKSDLKNNEIAMTQTSIATLEAVSELSCRIKLELRQDADEQQIESPGLPPGAVLRLKSLRSSGSGELAIDLRQIVPTSSVDMSSETEMQVEQMGHQETMTMKMTMGVSIERAKPPKK